MLRNRRGDRVKVLGWDGQGYWLLYKRLERGRFAWPGPEQAWVTVDTATLTLLLSGVDWRRFSPPRIRRPQLAAWADQVHLRAGGVYSTGHLPPDRPALCPVPWQ